MTTIAPWIKNHQHIVVVNFQKPRFKLGTTPTLARKRTKRLYENTIDKVYHSTSISNAKQILNEQQMRRSHGGMMGNGIYFARTIESAKSKARQTGVVLRAKVLMGKCKIVDHSDNDADMTFAKLKEQGFDSVVYKRYAGDEVVVYDWHQCIDIHRVE